MQPVIECGKRGNAVILQPKRKAIILVNTPCNDVKPIYDNLISSDEVVAFKMVTRLKYSTEVVRETDTYILAKLKPPVELYRFSKTRELEYKHIKLTIVETYAVIYKGPGKIETTLVEKEVHHNLHVRDENQVIYSYADPELARELSGIPSVVERVMQLHKNGYNTVGEFIISYPAVVKEALRLAISLGADKELIEAMVQAASRTADLSSDTRAYEVARRLFQIGSAWRLDRFNADRRVQEFVRAVEQAMGARVTFDVIDAENSEHTPFIITIEKQGRRARLHFYGQILVCVEGDANLAREFEEHITSKQPTGVVQRSRELAFE